jgi:hypothetical protein
VYEDEKSTSIRHDGVILGRDRMFTDNIVDELGEKSNIYEIMLSITRNRRRYLDIPILNYALASW